MARQKSVILTPAEQKLATSTTKAQIKGANKAVNDLAKAKKALTKGQETEHKALTKRHADEVKAHDKKFADGHKSLDKDIKAAQTELTKFEGDLAKLAPTNVATPSVAPKATETPTS